MTASTDNTEILTWVAQQLWDDTPEGRVIRDLAAGKFVMVPRVKMGVIQPSEMDP